MILVLKNDDINKIVAIHDDSQNITSSMYPSCVIKKVSDKTIVDMDTMTYILPTLSFDELYTNCYNLVTQKTSEILDGKGFCFNNVHFYTDLTAQFNWNCLMIQKDVLVYPFEIWDGEQHLTFNDSASLMQFLQAAFQYVYEKRYEGKLIRDSLAGMTYEELLNFIDPRG